jgi:heme exporter protein C
MLQPLIFVLALVLLAVGAYLGLVWAPPEAMMGEVQRIMYVHVPAVWMTLLCYTVVLVAGVMYLWKRDIKYDALGEAAAEVGVFFNVLGLCLGSIWGKPTWGAYWTWDPRLTSTLIMCLSFIGLLALRRFVDDIDKRPRFAAVFAVVAYANIPLVWFSVRWFRSMHQTQSSPSTVASSMVLPLRVNAFAFLFLMIWFIWRRYSIAQRDTARASVPPPVLNA